MTIAPEPYAERVLTTFRAAPLRHVQAGVTVPDTARHRAPETGEIRIVAADDCARRGRHAAPDETVLPAAVDAGPAVDPLAWIGLRFTAG